MCRSGSFAIKTEVNEIVRVKFHMSDLTVLDVSFGKFVSQMRPVFEMVQKIQESEHAACLEQAEVNESVIDFCVWGAFSLKEGSFFSNINFILLSNSLNLRGLLSKADGNLKP